MDVGVIIKTMIELFLMLILGYILLRCDIFDEHVNKKISSLIVNCTSPLMIISSMDSVDSSHKEIVFILMGVGILMYIGFIILAKIMVRVFPFPKKDRPVYECMGVFANTAFMGYPVLLSLFDEASIFYASLLHTAYSLFIYTYAIICLKQDDDFHFNYKLLWTPGFVLLIIAIGLYVFDITLPSLIIETVDSVGSLTSPLSMMMIGSSLALYPIKESLTDLYSYLFAIIRLLIIPFVTMIVCRLLALDPYISNITIITNAMPVGSMVLMMATQYNANKEIVTKNIIVSTFLSVITIPIVATMMLI